MIQRVTDLNDPRWMSLFTGIKSSWFRLETLQQYAVDYEAEQYREFQRTGVLDHSPGHYQRIVAEHSQAGRSLRRVHIIEHPRTPYLDFEIAVYEINARAGEDIRIIPTVSGEWPSDIPRQRDFWLFDDSDLWVMIYDDQGRFVAAEQITEPNTITQHRRWRDLALAQAIPLADYTLRVAS